MALLSFSPSFLGVSNIASEKNPRSYIEKKAFMIYQGVNISMIPLEDPKLAEEAFKKDFERVITKGERVVKVCTNPKCFEDVCKGECQEDSPLAEFDTNMHF